MPVQTADGNVVSLNKIHAYADRLVNRGLISGLFTRSPLFSYLTGRMTQDSNLGRPGTLGLIGGRGNFSAVDRTKEMGIEVHDRVLADRTGGFKIMGERDTTPSTGNSSQDQNIRTPVWRWSGVFSQPIKIWNSTIRLSTNARLGNVVKEAVDQAMEELDDNLAWRLWRGAPSDQSANVWDDVLGVIHVMHTSNTYANIDRSSSTFVNPVTGETENYWASHRVTTAKTPSLDLIDDAMFVQRLADKQNAPPDLVLCGMEVYHQLKKEALSRGPASVISDEIPEFSKLGVQFEAIRYGRTTIVCDPLLRGDWSSYDADITDASKVVAMFTSEDWIFAAHPTENFRTTPFVDQGESKPGGDDAITAEIRVIPRLRCRRPWRQILYTNVG